MSNSLITLLNPTLSELGFHGSYRPEDVTFLMQIDDIQPTCR